MVEHHDLVNHRQFEMGGRVIDRNAGVFDQRDDQQAHGDERECRQRIAQVPMVIAW